LYGRNGRPRFGFYQNGDIKDGATLLQKTWEALKQTNKPKISITGTVADLYRLGYKDQPIRLHDLAIVDIPETGESFYIQIIRCDVDLIDPTATRPEIGDYIASIVYINRETNEKASGGGGGGGRGKTNQEDDNSETWSAIEKTNNMIALVVGTRNGNNYVKAGEIGLAINKSGETGQYESTAYINADHVNISATQTAHTLAGDLEHDAKGRLVIKNASGLYVTRNSALLGVWDKGNLTGSVMVQQINGQSSVKISGDVIDINGSQITINADRIDINGIVSKLRTEQIACVSIHTTGGSNLFEGANSFPDTVTMQDLTYQNNSVSWQSATIPTFTYSNQHSFVYQTNGTQYTVLGYIIGTKGTKTINYLGKANS
jgi:hypothetical protein